MLHDGTATDRFAVYTDTLSVDPNPFEDCPCDEAVIKCLRIAFIWAPTFRDQLTQIHFVTKWRSDLVIVEPGNAYESSLLLSLNWTAQFDLLLETDGHLRLGVLHFPWGKQPIGRETALNSWINDAHSERKSYTLQSAMYPPGNSQGRKSFHFACGLGRVDHFNDNIKAVEPCSDLSDTGTTILLPFVFVYTQILAYLSLTKFLPNLFSTYQGINHDPFRCSLKNNTSWAGKPVVCYERYVLSALF